MQALSFHGATYLRFTGFLSVCAIGLGFLSCRECVIVLVQVCRSHCDKWAGEGQEMRSEGRKEGRGKVEHEWRERMCMNEAGRGVLGWEWWMSWAWPLFQVNLRGVFDHGGDLNDHLVIERRKWDLNRHREHKWSPRWLQGGRREGSKREAGGRN